MVWEWQLSDAERDAPPRHDGAAERERAAARVGGEVARSRRARAGRRADRIPEQGLWPDCVLEIEPVRPRGAKIVWEWHVWDHLVQNHDPEAANYGDPAAHPGRIDLNAGAHAPAIDAAQLEQLKALGYVPDDAKPEDLRSDFLHVNAVAYHPRLDQIALSVPMLGEIWIIDHGTTTEEAEAAGGRPAGGDLLYRWGNPAAYGRGGDGERRAAPLLPARRALDPRRLGGRGQPHRLQQRARAARGRVVVRRRVDAAGRTRTAATRWSGGAFGPAALAWQYRARAGRASTRPSSPARSGSRTATRWSARARAASSSR